MTLISLGSDIRSWLKDNRTKKYGFRNTEDCILLEQAEEIFKMILKTPELKKQLKILIRTGG